MCAPFVTENVRKELSRRGFIGVIAGGAVAAAAPAAGAAETCADAERIPRSR